LTVIFLYRKGKTLISCLRKGKTISSCLGESTVLQRKNQVHYLLGRKKKKRKYATDSPKGERSMRGVPFIGCRFQF